MVDQGGKFESPGRQRIESSAVHTLGPNTHVPMVDVVPSPPHIVQQTLLSAFPVELLVRIFAHLSKEDLLHQTIAPYAYLFRTLRWFVVAHVCRQWRAVAIDSPTLWQDVDFAMGPTWADVMLSRARTLPVTIHKSFIPVIVDRSFGHVAPLKHWEIFPRREIDLLKAHLFHVERLLLKGPPSGNCHRPPCCRLNSSQVTLPGYTPFS
ncbi:hypothetical protein BV25DRAFT_190059 [Artomyces pyxidatus]|uniref:Uncharacterized protein n=1 Tax=Artomyces pyxidatus TaxID=48021 RepID=A0ACB8T9C9_9AGAM|nr:hypothetical protein BV25DRAFT_190059 [Artomyces pyxidatus]